MRILVGIFVALFLMVHTAWAGLQLGQVPPRVELKGDLGGRIDDTPWSSNEMRGKVHVIFYVDPDEKDLNNEASDALKAENFPREKFQSLGIINMAATWLPNFAISSALKKKQERYPTTIYIRDYKKALVNAWGIADDNSDILAFDKEGRMIYYKAGKLDAEDTKALIQVIRDHIDK